MAYRYYFIIQIFYFYNLVFLVADRNPFSDFVLQAKAADSADVLEAKLKSANPRRVGRFQLFSDSLTKFSEECVNTISSADDLDKREIQAMWVAPVTGSGCVAFTASVYQSEKWYTADRQQLTRVLCETLPEQLALDKAKKMVDECCACDEAKYNVSR